MNKQQHKVFFQWLRDTKVNTKKISASEGAVYFNHWKEATARGLY